MNVLIKSEGASTAGPGIAKHNKSHSYLLRPFQCDSLGRDISLISVSNTRLDTFFPSCLAWPAKDSPVEIATSAFLSIGKKGCCTGVEELPIV